LIDRHADFLPQATSSQKDFIATSKNQVIMKNFYFLMVCLMTALLISCQKEEPKTTGTTGILHIDVGVDIHVVERQSLLKSTLQTEDFKVVIFRADGTVVMTFENALEMPDMIELETGYYYVEAHSDNNLPAAFENPYYYGVSDIFAISSNLQESVTVTCRLANTIVSVVYSGNITDNFLDYSTTVSSSLGTLVFSREETRLGYFQTLPLDILVELSYQKLDGTPVSKTLTGNIPDPLANRHYEIQVDASINEGMANFQILLDETVVEVEVVDISDESGNQQNGAVGYGEILITEIMYDPDALGDTEGEWIEIYNNSTQTINLQHLLLGREDDISFVIEESIELPPAEYFVFKRTEQAVEVTNSLSYNSAINLNNTGNLLAIYNAGTETEPGALIFALNYGEDGFPTGSGASICLNPMMLNAAEAVLGTSWCTSTSAYSTGDLGTPGTVNDPCQ